jgi:hypothetical protein
MRFAALFFAAIAPALGQSAPGVIPAWELNKQLDGLIAQVRKLMPLLEQVRTQDWSVDGYTAQRKAAMEQVEYLSRSAGALAREPEKMSFALDAYLRLDALEKMLDSLSEGVRRHQNPALGDLIQAAISENATHRGRLQNYLVELVATKQDELRIANEEAQRCRSAVMNPTSTRRPASTTSKKP